MSGSIATITLRLLDCQFLKLNRSILLVMGAGNIVNPRIGSDPLPPRDSIPGDARSGPVEPAAPGWPAGLNPAKITREKRGREAQAIWFQQRISFTTLPWPLATSKPDHGSGAGAPLHPVSKLLGRLVYLLLGLPIRAGVAAPYEFKPLNAVVCSMAAGDYSIGRLEVSIH